jgi:P27 family predicted phage terminase small subunit
LTDRGTGKKVRRLVLAPKAPAAPAGLSKVAAAEWRRVVPELERAGVLATIDRGVLTGYCTAWAHMMEAEAALKTAGVVHLNREKVLVKSPAWQVYREALRTMILAARECYLTPTARLRIPVPAGLTDADDDDDADALFD